MKKISHPEQPVIVTDLYEAAWLLMSGCTLDEVSCIPLSDSLSCRLYFSGERLAWAKTAFRERMAQVNLHDFRQAYGQVNGYVHLAKKSFDRERRAARKGGL